MNSLLTAVAISMFLLGSSGERAVAVEREAPPPPAAEPTVALERVPVDVVARVVLPWQAPRTARGPLFAAAEYRRGRKLYLLPHGCAERAELDVVIHFHGSPKVMTKNFRESALDAVAVVVNLGALSGPYEKAFERPGSFVNFLAGIDRDLAERCPGAKRGRVAISSWSGGYGAAYRILVDEGNDQLVDAILFSDGLHSALANKLTRELKAEHLAPFTRFAKLAAKGEKLMAIAHSSIVPPAYSSTTETADFLLRSQGGSAERVDEAGPRDSMRLTSRGAVSGLTVLGFAGNDTDAHCDHLYAIGGTLFSQLAQRWAR